MQKPNEFWWILVVFEAYVAEPLTPRTLDLEDQALSLAHRVVFLDKELLSTLSSSLHPGV